MFYRNHKLYMSEDGTTGGGGTPSNTSNIPDNNSAQVELLTKAVGLLAQSFEELKGNQTTMTEALARLSEGTGQTIQQTQAVAENLFGDDVDVEQLSRKDFAKLIKATIEHGIETKLEQTSKTFSTKVDNLANAFEQKNAGEQINKTAEKNADFWEWSSEIKQILSENPTLTVNRAYALAKSENSDKVEKMKTKYDKPVIKKQNNFLGLTPTSGARSSTDGTVKMTAKAAAEKAFDDIMADLGDVFTKDQNLA